MTINNSYSGQITIIVMKRMHVLNIVFFIHIIINEEMKKWRNEEMIIWINE